MVGTSLLGFEEDFLKRVCAGLKDPHARGRRLTPPPPAAPPGGDHCPPPSGPGPPRSPPAPSSQPRIARLAAGVGGCAISCPIHRSPRRRLWVVRDQCPIIARLAAGVGGA
jgi:hypothetical protein